MKDSAERVTWDLPRCSSSIKEIKVQCRNVKSSRKEVTMSGLETPGEIKVWVVVVDIKGNQHITKTLGTVQIGNNLQWCNSKGYIKLWEKAESSS